VNDLTVFPAHLNELSVGQLSSLPHLQLHEVDTNLEQLIDWAKKARTKVDAALEQRYGEQARKDLTDSGRDVGTTHLTDGPLRIRFELPKRVSWDQKQLGVIAERIVAAGERVQDYMDVDLSVSELRFNNWPPALKEQFAQARTVKPGKPSYRLALAQENHA
jgi:hypothetical protein